MSINTSTGNKMRHGKTFFRARTVCIRSLLAFVSVLFVAGSAFSGNDINPDAIELIPLPMPIEMKSDMDSPVAFDSRTLVVLECPDAVGVKWLAAHFAEWFGADAPKVTGGKTGLVLTGGNEAYAIESGVAGVKIAARSLAGVRWAA